MKETLSLFFKPETRKQGADLATRETFTLAQASDTQIRAFIRKSPPISVTFLSDAIDSPVFTADCSCSLSAKGKLCKHMWATLLVVDKKCPDFLDAKIELRKAPAREASPRVAPAVSPSRKEFEAAYKEKQAAYRKQQYQAQKQRLKARRSDEKTGKSRNLELPAEVAAALKYFSENGFPLAYPADQEELVKAKRILSTVFHPDKGGAHEEMLELIRNVKILTR